MSQEIADLTKIIVDNIYVPLLNDVMSIYEFEMRDSQIAENNCKIFCNIFRNNIFVGTLAFWMKKNSYIKFHEISYKSDNSNSYDDTDPNSGFILDHINGINNNKIDTQMIREILIRFFLRVNKYEENNNSEKCPKSEKTYIVNEDYIVDEDQNHETTFEEIYCTEDVPSEIKEQQNTELPVNNYVVPIYPREEFIAILTKTTNTVILRTINFVKKNLSQFESGKVINLCPYLEEQEKNNDMMFFGKLLKNYIFKKKLSEELDKFGLNYKIKGINKILIHSQSVIVH